jgi:hypothetical protein
MHLAMFYAGWDFLDELIDENTLDACRDVRIILEHRSKSLWVYRVSGATTVSQRGSHFDEVAGAPTADDEEDLRRAASYATHVHVAWKPRDAAGPLALPEI